MERSKTGHPSGSGGDEGVCAKTVPVTFQVPGRAASSQNALTLESELQALRAAATARTT
jgi:hypothetical protein